MFLEIIYQSEKIIIPNNLKESYKGCQVIRELEEIPKDNEFEMMPELYMLQIHTQKAIEAVLILSGYNLKTGLLYNEAKALGISLIELAETVNNKRQLHTQFEVNRRLYKKEVK
jgi:hypothetical protein